MEIKFNIDHDSGLGEVSQDDEVIVKLKRYDGEWLVMPRSQETEIKEMMETLRIIIGGSPRLKLAYD